MKNTYLIQRLKKSEVPFKGGAKILENIWRLDYMGSAEFEFWVIPRTLQNIIRYCAKGDASNSKLRLKKDVYYICEKKDEPGVVKVIKKLSKNEYGYFHLKEFCGLEENLKGEKSAQKYAGWIELNNEFMFFVDKEMYDLTSALLLPND